MKRIKFALCLVACLAAGIRSQQAHAYTAQATCNGVVKWPGIKNLIVDTCTTPVNSPADLAVQNGYLAWGSIYNSIIANILHQWFNCSLTYGDGTNEFMLVTQQTIGSGLNGLTTYHYD